MMASLQTIIICIANDPKDHAMVIPKHNCEDIIEISCLICLSSDMLLPIQNKTILCGYYFAGCSVSFYSNIGRCLSNCLSDIMSNFKTCQTNSTWGLSAFRTYKLFHWKVMDVKDCTIHCNPFCTLSFYVSEGKDVGMCISLHLFCFFPYIQLVCYRKGFYYVNILFSHMQKVTDSLFVLYDKLHELTAWVDPCLKKNKNKKQKLKCSSDSTQSAVRFSLSCSTVQCHLWW